MIHFEYVAASPEKDTKENVRLIISYLNDLTDSLNILSSQLAELKDKESEGK